MSSQYLIQILGESVRAIGLDEDVLQILRDFALNGTPIQKNYIILFGLVRLAGLYEVIAPHTPPAGIRVLNTLYHDMNTHLMGLEGPTDAYEFAIKWTALADWNQ